MQSAIAYLPYLQFRKALNLSLIHLSYFFSSLFKINWYFGRPYFLTLEPTTACNLRCPQCPSGLRSFSRPTGNLKHELLHKILHDGRNFLMHIQFYFQGEPFIHPDLPDFIKIVHQKKIYTSVSTNAHFLSPEKAEQIVRSGLDELIISLDGMSQETYEHYRRGGSFEEVIQGIRNLVECRKSLNSKKPFIVIQFLVFRHNEHEIKAFEDFAKTSGADAYRLKGPQVYDLHDADTWVPTIEKYARYKKVNGQWKIKNKFENKCKRMWMGCVVTWDGKVVPCCFDKDARYVMGEIGQLSLSEIILSRPYREFRSRLLKQRKDIDICKNCTEGTEGVY
ncbi:MAG: radical SAM protein [Bacteroidia bacterium]|nr:radical SAM protein [Bacteroidia bacterium]